MPVRSVSGNGETKVEYRTEQLILRTVTEDDAEEVARTWALDGRVLSEAEAAAVIARTRGDRTGNAEGSIRYLCLAICEAAAPRVIIGWCGLDGRRSHREPEIFVVLREGYRGRGYGTQCVRELLRIAADDYALESVHGSCAEGNTASRRAMEKGGMRQYGTGENGAPLFRSCLGRND